MQSKDVHLTKKNCLVYYLLKEYGDGREDDFAVDRLIPAHFKRGLDGLWALDHSQWKMAIQSFADPTVTPDFVPEIIRTLATLPPRQNRSDYLVRFYQLVQPLLDLPSVEIVMQAMCLNSNLRSAWSLQRTYQGADRTRLLQAIFACCFGLNDFKCPLAEPLSALIGFPFDEIEDSNMYQFAITSPRIMPLSHALVTIHFYLNKIISQARYIEAIRFERELSGNGRITSDLEIDRLVEAIRDVLPQVQLNMLELEFDQNQAQSSSIITSMQSGNPEKQVQSAENDLTASYDMGSMAWKPPAQDPDPIHPSSLAEVREQQMILNQPKPPILRNSLPLSASPHLRSTLPKVSLDKPNEPQKALLKALALHTQTPSSTPKPLHCPLPESDQPNRISQSETPRFTHFVSPARPPTGPNSSPPQSISKPRPLPSNGSPFHRQILDHRIPSSSEDRWPTRIVFTPRKPSKKQVDRLSSSFMNSSALDRREAPKTISSSESSQERPLAQSRLLKQKTQPMVAVASQPRVNAPPKKVAKLNKEPQANQSQAVGNEKVLPGGFQIDEDMADASDHETSQPRIAKPAPRSARKRTKTENLAPALPQITPRRSTRLHTTTPSRELMDEEMPFEDNDEPDSIDMLRKTAGKSKPRKKAGPR